MVKSTINRLAYLASIFVMLAALITPTTSYATSNNNNTQSVSSINRALCSVIGVLQGPAAKGIATVAIVFLAFGMFVGKVSWGIALATGIAVGVIFGAGEIANLLAGGTEDICATVSSTNN